VTSVGRGGLSILHLPRHTWGSHRVLVRCENNFESSPFSLYIARRHTFNSTCKINFWKCILLFEYPCIRPKPLKHTAVCLKAENTAGKYRFHVSLIIFGLWSWSNSNQASAWLEWNMNLVDLFKLTAWTRHLPDKLVVAQLVKNFPHLWNPNVHYHYHKSALPVGP
jgi:hypothetical protein